MTLTLTRPTTSQTLPQTPAHPAAVTARLKPLGLLAQQDKPCLIFSDDALALIFWVPTAVSALHVVIADANRDRAINIITSSLPYERFGPERGPASIDPAISIDE